MMKKYCYLFIFSMLAACAPATVDQVGSFRPTDTLHVAELPPEWTETPTSEQPVMNTSTATETAAATVTETVEPAAEAPDSMITPATLDPNAAQIIFVKKGECTVMSVSSSGGDAVPLTLTPFNDCAAAKISPDGKQVAYFGEQQSKTVFVADIEGSEARELATIEMYELDGIEVGAEKVVEILWSPNGEQLAILVEAGYLVGYHDLFLIDPEGEGEIQFMSLGPLVPDEPMFSGFPDFSWSPDGKWLFYTCLCPNVDAGKVAHRVSDSEYFLVEWFPEFYSSHYEWSPDSRTLAVIQDEIPEGVLGGSSQDSQQALKVETITIGTRREPVFIPLPVIDVSAGFEGGWDGMIGIRWSPNGETFLALRRNPRDLAVINKNGNLLNIVHSFPIAPLEIDWSPDGEWIYYITSGGSLEIVHPDGSDQRTLAEDVAPGSIVWK